MKGSPWRNGMRIVWAIAAKDIREAIVSRTTLAIMMGIALLVLSNSAIPTLVRLRDTPTAVIYDPDRTPWVRALTARDDLSIRFARSDKELAALVGGSADQVLGLHIPEGSQGAAVGDVTADLRLAGIVPHWAGAAAVEELTVIFEGALSEASRRSVEIDVADGAVYTPREEPGHAGMTISGFTMAMLTVGLAMVPLLFLEERESRTIETLMVSPARYGQIIAGKAVAGLTYGLAAGGVVVLLNARWIVSWWVALAAILLGATFAVALGLLLGILFRSSAALAAWAGLLLAGLLLPALVVSFGDAALPPWLNTLMTLLPSVAVNDLLWASMLPATSRPPLDVPVALLGAATLLLLMLTTWRIRCEARR